ncbi:hypothetical protein [Arthrobacter sp. UYCo732]|uniref:hypothetical protein n=1 Tax=Arthrobacter sp. UYCo732 TaxID=3156336 RepID=UPI0033945AF0
MSTVGPEDNNQPWQDEGVYTPPVPEFPSDAPSVSGRRSKQGRWIAAVLALSVAAAAGVSYVVTGPHSFASLGAQLEASRDRWPTPHRGGTGRLAPAATAGPSRDYVISRTENTLPVRYDPCDTIRYVIRPDNAPPGGEQMIHDAVAKTASATGLVFAYDGLTEESPSADRAKYQPERYGDRWAPLLISWTTPDETPAFTGDIAGFGGSSLIQSGQAPWIFVTGQVQVDGPLAQQLIGQGSAAQVQSLILHQMGHMVGLGHAEGTDELMYRANDRTKAAFSEGDLAGLALLGNGPCVPEY